MIPQLFSIILITQISTLKERYSIGIDGKTAYMFLKPIGFIHSIFFAYLKLDFKEEQDLIELQITMMVFMANDETKEEQSSGLLIPVGTEPIIKLKNIFGKFDAKEAIENLKGNLDFVEVILDTSNLNKAFRRVKEKRFLAAIRGLFCLDRNHITLVKESKNVVVSDGGNLEMQGRIVSSSDFESVWANN